MSRWDRYVLRPRVWTATSRSETVPHIGPYIARGTRSRDGSRDRYPRGWEVIEIPSCGDLHQRSSPTPLFRCNVGEDDLKPCMQSSWMILGSCYVGSKKFCFLLRFPTLILSEHNTISYFAIQIKLNF